MVALQLTRRHFSVTMTKAALTSMVGCGALVEGSDAQSSPFEDFLRLSPANFGKALDAAVDWSSKTGGTVSFAGTYRLTATAIVKKPVRFAFADATFVIIGEPQASISNGAIGSIGILFQDAEDIFLSGRLTVRGMGKTGRTSLAGIAFDSCSNVRAEATFTFEDLAIGMYVFWCDQGVFGDIRSTRMKGGQPFDRRASAGSTLVAIGCRSSRFGSIRATANYKPVLYCSVAFDRHRRAVDNDRCAFGTVHGSPFPGSSESSLIAVRSARNCTFAGARGDGFACGYYIGRYTGDDGFSVDGNTFGALVGDFPGTRFSTDAAIVQETMARTVPIGSNQVTSVAATCGGEFGILLLSGTLEIDDIDLSGSVRPIVIQGAILRARSISIGNQQDEAITLGGYGKLIAERVEVWSGSLGGQGSALRYNPAFGSVGNVAVDIGAISYRKNDIGTPLKYIIYDPVHDADSWRIGRIDGVATQGQAQFRLGKKIRYVNGRAIADP